MKTKSVVVFISALAFFLALHTLARSRVDAHRSDYRFQLHAAALPLPNEILRIVSVEFKGMVANYLLLESASFIGSSQSKDATAKEWESVARLLDQSSLLDPYFKNTYRLAQSILPWEAKLYDETLKILERSKRHITWDWEPGFFIGFDYYFFLGDSLTASKELMEASEIKHAPALLATLAARLAVRVGQTKTAIAFLSALYEKTDEEPRKEAIKERILALRGVELLQSAITNFERSYGRLPDSLEELVEKSILSEIPPNPYGRPYTLKDGAIEF